MLAEDGELVGLAKQWDAHGKLILCSVDEIDFDETSNLLAVYKDTSKDRLIMDRRARNSREVRVLSRELLACSHREPILWEYQLQVRIHPNSSCLRLYFHDLQHLLSLFFM